MKILALSALAALGLAACSKSDTSPTPEHNQIAAAMPDAAATPGAQGGTQTLAPHASPPPKATLSDTHPITPNSAPGLPPPGTVSSGKQ